MHHGERADAVQVQTGRQKLFHDDGEIHSRRGREDQDAKIFDQDVHRIVVVATGGGGGGSGRHLDAGGNRDTWRPSPCDIISNNPISRIATPFTTP